MNRYLATLLGVCFAIGFLIGSAMKYGYETTVFKPYEWTVPPIIVNCYGEDFSEPQMIRAVDYWTLRGHEIGFYEHNPPQSICESKDMVHGFIVIKKAKWYEIDGPTLASTKRMTSGLRVVAATIIYRKGSQNLHLINEHELGHALGYAHVEEEGHIMHPLYQKMGDGFWVP